MSNSLWPYIPFMSSFTDLFFILLAFFLGKFFRESIYMEIFFNCLHISNIFVSSKWLCRVCFSFVDSYNVLSWKTLRYSFLGCQKFINMCLNEYISKESFPWNNLFQSEYLCLFYGNKNFILLSVGLFLLFHFLCSHFLKLLNRHLDFWMNFYMLLICFFFSISLPWNKIKQETYMIPVLLELISTCYKEKTNTTQ